MGLEWGAEGRVHIGGRRWKGDCLVDFSGHGRLWVKQTELEMVAPNPEPRPSTAEEVKMINRQKVRALDPARWRTCQAGAPAVTF